MQIHQPSSSVSPPFLSRRNPNEAPQEVDHGGGGGSASRQERTRLKNIEWTAYESVHKKYLHLDTKPKLKNHYRAHRLSFWLNLVPDLHRPGNDDVPDSHHALDDDPEPEDEVPVKPINPPRQQQQRENNYTPPSVPGNLSAPATRSVNGSRYTKSATHLPEEATEGAQGGGPQEDGFAAYSTALSVTIAIGCSLLILNVLIFACVYYQRDKTRLNDSQHQHKKHSPSGPNNICGDLDVINTKRDPGGVLGHHHQLPPPEFADLPQRAPPPPKHLKSHPESQLIPSHALQLLSGMGTSGGGGNGTLQKKSNLRQPM